MDEDLKIVLTSKLEADEQASAKRISAQLPNIEKLVNAKSAIKIGVALDASDVQANAQKLNQQISKAVKTKDIGVSLRLDQKSVNKIQTALRDLNVSPDISKGMTEQLDRMGIQIDKISARWDDAAKKEEKALTVSLNGTDQLGRTISYMGTYNAEMGRLEQRSIAVVDNLEKQRQTASQISAQVKKDNETRLSSLTKLESKLEAIKSKYSDVNAPGAIKNQDSLRHLDDSYKEIGESISRLKGMDGKLSLVDAANIEKQISALKDLAAAYRNLESAGTKLRKKDVEAIKVDQNAGLDKLEEQLRNAGILTDEFKQRIGQLKNELSGVSDPAGIRSFLDGMDSLKADVGVFQEKIRGVNSAYKELIELQKEIHSIQSEIDSLDPSGNGNEIEALRGKLSLRERERAAIEEQIAAYGDLTRYASQAKAAEESRLHIEEELKQAQAQIADEARKADEQMGRMPATMQNLKAKMSQLVEPSENLTMNMKDLETLVGNYSKKLREADSKSTTESERERVQIWEKINGLVSECKGEMSELSRVQRKDVQDFKFTQNLEKAKADLETIGRQWSALFSDGDLTAAFRDLKTELKNINNQADLSKWTAEFGRFKSEVKAAGKNAQSFFDVVKNNIGKVSQWALATISIYDAFNLLKSSVQVIVDLDTAMIDLKKTTNETDAAYKRFYASANETAKRLGVTTEAVISQTAEWSRLGYTMADAAKMAENSAIFKAISPEMDISTATDGLISVMKAFDLEANDVLDGVISKINKVGNELPVSNLDIVEVLKRSSSAMDAANNSLEQTIALATAGVAITRDAEGMGQALKTLSMRIRGYDEETEEYSEDIAVLTGKVADLTKTASNGGRGVSLFEVDDPERYRSTYDILKEISEIWDELTDKNQAQLLEVLFGKRQGQVGAAILSNFADAELAMEKMQNSTGNAMAEMEKVYDSLEYKLNSLRETWVGVAQSFLDSDFLKGAADGVNFLSSKIAALIKTIGPLGTLFAGGGIFALGKNFG